MSDVKILRLINGMEVIGREIPSKQVTSAFSADIATEDSSVVTLSNPLIVHTVPQGPNQFGVAVQPYSLVGKTAEVEFSRNHIISIVEAEEQTALQYRSSQAGIVTPDAGAPQPDRRLHLVD